MPEWKFDPAHTRVGFAARHMMVTTVHGQFQQVSGGLHFDPEHKATASVEAIITAASLTSGVADRDNHLRSADFLDVTNYPEITFKSTGAEPLSDHHGKMHGELTIRDVTRPVVLDVEFNGRNKNPWGAEVAGFSAATKISRKDWNLTWNVALEAGGWLVGDEIAINIEVELNKRD